MIRNMLNNEVELYLENDCEDQALVATTVCTDHSCWESIGTGYKKPELKKDANGFYRCPKCNVSYGREAF